MIDAAAARPARVIGGGNTSAMNFGTRA